MEPLKTDTGTSKPQSALRRSKKGPMPEGAVKWGRCPGCQEMAWLFKWEGDKLMCEDCIQEAHDDAHSAEDAMAEAELEPEDWEHEEDWGDGEEYY